MRTKLVIIIRICLVLCFIFVSFQSELLDVTHQHVRTWIVSLMDDGIEARTINRKISSLRSFYKFLQREDLIGNSPMSYVRAPKIPKRLPIVITEQKMDILLDAQDVFSNDFHGIRDRLIIELLYGTGIRLSELVNLADNDINVYEQQIKVLGKRNKERIIPISKPLAKLVGDYQLQKLNQNFDNKSSALIVTNQGNKVYAKFIYRTVNLVLSFISTSLVVDSRNSLGEILKFTSFLKPNVLEKAFNVSPSP
jgi:integrase/recombinase XerC